MSETATEHACPKCIEKIDDTMRLYSEMPGETPDSYNDLEKGEGWYFCPACFQEYVSKDWYNEHY